MHEPDKQESEARFEQFLGNLLRVGVLLAAAVVSLGGVIYLVNHGQEIPHNSVFKGEPADLRSPSGIVQDALTFQGRGLIQFGLLLLVATPVSRVFFSAIGFLRERDYTYVGFTLVVLTVLLYSLFFGASL